MNPNRTSREVVVTEPDDETAAGSDAASLQYLAAALSGPPSSALSSGGAVTNANDFQPEFITSYTGAFTNPAGLTFTDNGTVIQVLSVSGLSGVLRSVFVTL